MHLDVFRSRIKSETHRQCSVMDERLYTDRHMLQTRVLSPADTITCASAVRQNCNTGRAGSLLHRFLHGILRAAAASGGEGCVGTTAAAQCHRRHWRQAMWRSMLRWMICSSESDTPERHTNYRRMPLSWQSTAKTSPRCALHNAESVSVRLPPACMTFMSDQGEGKSHLDRHVVNDSHQLLRSRMLEEQVSKQCVEELTRS